MSVEHFTSGLIPQRGDTKRILTAKRLNSLGGIALKSDTIRLLRAKIDRIVSGGGTNTGPV